MVEKNTYNQNESKVKKENQVFDSSMVSNEEISRYIKEIELRREKNELLNERLKEEDSKINILNRNISKLSDVNSSLNNEASKARTETTKLAGEVAELKLELEKAEAESKLKKVKKIKSDILINAKILKDQENTINKLKAKKEQIIQHQESERNKLLQKRVEIEKLKSINAQENIDSEIMDIIESSLLNNADKKQIMSEALNDASEEMLKINNIDALISSRTNDNIELLKTQMLELNGLVRSNINEDINSLNNTKNATSDYPISKITPKTAESIEAETMLIGKLDKLVKDGLITNQDKEKEIEKFKFRNSIKNFSDKNNTEEDNNYNKKIKKTKKLSKTKFFAIFLMILVQLGVIALIVLIVLKVITI